MFCGYVIWLIVMRARTQKLHILLLTFIKCHEIFGDGINNILLNNWFSKGFFKQLNKSSSGIARKYSIEAIYEIMIIKILSAYGFKLADIKLLIAEIDFQNRRSLGWILSGYKHGNIKYQPASDIVYNTSGMIV